MISYSEFSAKLERYQYHLLSQDLLFADEKHQLEVTNLIALQKRDSIIWGILCGLFVLSLFLCWLYYSYRLSRSKKIIAEKDNAYLRLEQTNLNNEINELEAERDKLKELLKEQTELTPPVQEVIISRLDMLNGLLAKEITNNDKYAKPYNKWIESIRTNKNEFMNSTREAFNATHPQFIEYLKEHGLSDDEMNYLCLYAIGLRGKEVGEYMQLRRHYNISSEIRKKLGIDEHDPNIGPFIRKKMNEL